MVKINDSTPIKGYGNIKKKSKTSGGGGVFAGVLSAASSSSDGTSDTSGIGGVASVGGLLALQEVSDEEVARNETVKHGNNLIKSLEALRQSLLLGNVPIDVLRTLETRLKTQRQATIDPALHEIMDDIELRAAVELAKYEMAARSGGYL